MLLTALLLVIAQISDCTATHFSPLMERMAAKYTCTDPIVSFSSMEVEVTSDEKIFILIGEVRVDGEYFSFKADWAKIDGKSDNNSYILVRGVKYFEFDGKILIDQEIDVSIEINTSLRLYRIFEE